MCEHSIIDVGQEGGLFMEKLHQNVYIKSKNNLPLHRQKTESIER